MAAKRMRGFSSIIKWVKANQITFINVTVTIALVGIVIIVLIGLGSTQITATAEESMANLAGMIANEVQAHILTYFDAARNIAQMITSFENIEVSRRRDFIINTMRTGLESNYVFNDIYTIWRPDALDGLDYLYANTEGYDETGQFISGFTRERGWIEPKRFDDYGILLEMDFFNYFSIAGERLSEPWRKAIGSTLDCTWFIDMWVPIFGESLPDGTAEVICVIGATIQLEYIQVLCEATKPYGTGRIFVCNNNGIIVAHQNSEMRGVGILTPYNNDTQFSDEIYHRLRRTIMASMSGMTRNILRTKDDLMKIYPLRTTTTMALARGAIQTPPWALVAIIPMATIMAPVYAMYRFSAIFIVGAGIVMAFVLLATSKSLTKHASDLQRSLEHSSIMQDNLKYGLFLVDENYIIQGAYSKALEKILSVPGLQGKSLLELFSSSLKAPEQEGFAYYLEMIIKETFDRDMLASINPINEFTYVNNTTGEVKSLRTSFTVAEQGMGKAYILGIMEDITAETELEKQLLQAENLRESEMRSLFQVIQLDPGVLKDFVADAEYEFEIINEALKGKEPLPQETLVKMYHSIHAVKSNALILNMESLSERMHKLESTIKELRKSDKEIVDFDDSLGLILEFNDAMKEIDQLRTALSKIENFRIMSGGDKNQERYVLVETLTRVCKETQKALGKKAKLVVDEIDEAVLDYGPRRAIKEILTQLIRNAVYHGFESPEERETLGKAPEGEIRLSISRNDNQIIIKLTDNGSGIDLDRVRKAAKTQFVSRKANDEDYPDESELIEAIFLPGFSTVDEADFHAGRGIGLNLVSERVKELSGNITATTAAGKGTTFVISIPLEVPAADHAS